LFAVAGAPALGVKQKTALFTVPPPQGVPQPAPKAAAAVTRTVQSGGGKWPPDPPSIVVGRVTVQRSSGESGSTNSLKKQFETAARGSTSVVADPQKSDAVKATLRRKKEEVAAAAAAAAGPQSKKKGSRLVLRTGSCGVCFGDTSELVVLECCGFASACRDCVMDLVVSKLHDGLRTPCLSCGADLPYTG
jgi:hypothetical protein